MRLPVYVQFSRQTCPHNYEYDVERGHGQWYLSCLPRILREYSVRRVAAHTAPSTSFVNEVERYAAVQYCPRCDYRVRVKRSPSIFAIVRFYTAQENVHVRKATDRCMTDACSVEGVVAFKRHSLRFHELVVHDLCIAATEHPLARRRSPPRCSRNT